MIERIRKRKHDKKAEHTLIISLFQKKEVLSE